MSINSAKQIVPGLEYESGATLDEQNAVKLVRVQVKTADYTVLETDSGTTFTTYGDTGAIIFTLPTNPKKGLNYRFIQSTDQDLTITAGTADTLITYNNLLADGVATSTASHQIGAVIEVLADGNAFHAWCTSGHTFTVVDI